MSNYSVPPIDTLRPLPTEHFGRCARPGCGLPALPVCGLTLPTLVGSLHTFFCFPDYLSLVKTLQVIDDQENRQKLTTDTFRPLREQIVALAPHLLEGRWPTREELMTQWKTAQTEYERYRQVYQQAVAPSEHRPRIQTLHQAALFLFAALCLEDRPQQNGLYNRVVDATWAQIVSPFLTEERMVIFEKAITRSEVLLALVTIVFCRIDSSRNEEMEQTIIAQTLQETAQKKPPQDSEEQPEFHRALLLLSAQMQDQKHPQQRYWGPLNAQEREEQRTRARANSLLSGGLRRLSEKTPPTTAQAPFVSAYIQTFLSQIAVLKRQRDVAAFEADDWKNHSIRLAKEWNEMLQKQEETERTAR